MLLDCVQCDSLYPQLFISAQLPLRDQVKGDWQNQDFSKSAEHTLFWGWDTPYQGGTWLFLAAWVSCCLTSKAESSPFHMWLIRATSWFAVLSFSLHLLSISCICYLFHVFSLLGECWKCAGVLCCLQVALVKVMVDLNSWKGKESGWPAALPKEHFWWFWDVHVHTFTAGMYHSAYRNGSMSISSMK